MTTATATKSPTVRLDAKDVAKFVRKALRAAFPNVKFSVRSSGYNALNVAWTDGPTAQQVKAVANEFKGIKKTLDPYTDYRTDEDIADNATGSANWVSSIHYSRTVSDQARAAFRAEVMEFANASTYSELQDIWNDGQRTNEKSGIVWHFIADMPTGSSWDVAEHLNYFESIALRGRSLTA
ncbi:LPD29 domain-containing protein [Citricoccus nitrophenolicus]|uniref:LPD29 domain-containing protein n=1 Tax=Citricoccus nitrophenolicus TaxID=863575 RepID=UPI0031E71EA4